MSEKELITEFLLAAEQGNADGLKSCLAKNVDINATNRQGRTAIIIASLNKHYDCVSLLIAAGADINKQDQTCFNPFLISCLTNDLTLLRTVLPANPDLNCLSRFGGVGITPASEKVMWRSCASCCCVPISMSTIPTSWAGRRFWKPLCLMMAARSSRRSSSCYLTMAQTRI